MPDAARRAIRTFVQAFTGIILGQAVVLMTDLDDGEIDWQLWKRVVISALAAGIVALLSWLQNWSEDRGVIPALLKATASSGANPVTRDPKV
jgi:hypothetical protein